MTERYQSVVLLLYVRNNTERRKVVDLKTEKKKIMIIMVNWNISTKNVERLSPRGSCL